MVVYGLTIYSTFLSPVADRLVLLTLFALLFAGIAFFATSTWALGGAVINKHLRHATARMLVNTTLALLLVYSAIDLSGIGAWVQ